MKGKSERKNDELCSTTTWSSVSVVREGPLPNKLYACHAGLYAISYPL
jgi:hypothetical protein